VAGTVTDAGAGGDGSGDPGAGEVVYDLADWEPERRATLDRLLRGEGATYRWDQAASPASWMTPDAVSGPASPAFLSHELVVAEGDADLVEELIDELDHPDALDAEDDDGNDLGAEVLSALYVAADVLSGAPGHVQAAEDLLDAAGMVGEIEAPYGLDPVTWRELGRLGDQLARCLREGADEEAVVGAARALRQAVHPLV
jgi:hypothetical protein